MSDIDPCDILARHQHHRGQWGNGACTSRFGGPEHCLPYMLASAVVEAELKVESVEELAASEARPVVVRSVVRGSRRYWLIDGLEAHAVWVTRQLPDPHEVTDTHAIWHYPHGSTLSIERSLLDPDDPAYTRPDGG